MSRKTLGPMGIEFFESRGISPEVAVRYGTYTAKSGSDDSVIPHDAGNIVVFPYLDCGHVVAEKYRGRDKRFWQRGNGLRTFWNADALDDPALETGEHPLVITEGEIDALTAIDCGFPLTVSVPDGAPPVRDGEDPEQLAPLDERNQHTGKFEFLWKNRDRLKRIKRFVLAVDNDGPGKRLAAELVRRLSASRCYFVTYPDGCKDLNDVLVRHGADAVAAVLSARMPYPVRGLYTLSEYPDLPDIDALSTGWWTLDAHLKIFAGEFMVITGIPAHGKSSWVVNLMGNLADRYGWRFAVFSPEMPTKPQLRGRLRRIKTGRDDPAADDWIEDHFVFIAADPTGRVDQDFDLDWLIDRATDAVLRHGIRALVIDPWNEIEHARRRDETVTDYIGRSIRALKRFALLHSVAVFVVAHPTKDVMGRDGKVRPVTLYDIDGSAHWHNKADHGVVIERQDPSRYEGVVRIAKVRFEEDTGERGSVRLRFERISGRFLTLDTEQERMAS